MAMMPISFSMARGSRVFLKGRCQLSAALKAMSTVSKGKRRMASASTSGSVWPLRPRKRTSFWSRAFTKASRAPPLAQTRSTSSMVLMACSCQRSTWSVFSSFSESSSRRKEPSAVRS